MNVFELLANDPHQDIDKLRIKILLLVKDVRSIESTANYLNRRGWEAILTNQIKEAFKMATTFQPDLVLVSVNIDHPKMEQLPLVITQSFKIPVMIFGEKSDTLTLKLMQSVHATYKLQGAASGPTIHRRIQQLLRDTIRPTFTTHDSTLPNQTEQGTFTVRGEGEAKDRNYTFETGSMAKDSPEYLRFAADPQTPSSGIDGRFKLKNEQNSKSDNSEEQQDMLSEFKLKKETSAKTSSGENELRDESLSLNLPKEENSSRILPKENTSNENQRNEVQAAAEYDGKMDIERACRDAFSSYLRSRKGKGNKIEQISETFVLSLTDGQQQGSLMLFHAEGGNRLNSFGEHFVQQFERHSQTQTFNLRILDIFAAKFPTTPFQHKIKGEMFSFRLPSEEGEVAIKFIPFLKRPPSVTEMEGHDKLNIRPTDLVAEQQPGVDVFMYLPLNGKYFKIVSNCATISQNQKQRLDMERFKLFIDKEDLELYVSNQQRNQAVSLLYESFKKNKKSA